MTAPAQTSMCVVLIGYSHGQGGIQTHTRYLAEGLRERGHQVHVFSPSPMREHDSVPAVSWATSYNSLFDLVRLVRKACPDVAVVTGTGWKSMLGVLAASRDCRKIFFEVMSGARAKTVDPRVLVNFGFDTIVGQGAPVTRKFVKEFGWPGTASTIPALPEPLERQFKIPKRDKVGPSSGVRFAYFGRVTPPKNVRLLVESFLEFAPAASTLDIWGGGPDVEPLENLAAALGLANRIRLCGRYPEGRDYIELLQQYDLLLLPTIAEEGAPLVLLEAMACGLPFVANGMGGIPDYANPDCMITDGDIEKFLPAVRAMVSRLEKGDFDPARLQAHYLQDFGFDTLVDRWEALLRKCTFGSVKKYQAA